MNNKVYMISNPFTPGKAVEINPEICNGCNTCVEVCRSDVLMPNPEKGNQVLTIPPLLD